MRIVLCETSHAHETVQSPASFVTINRAELRPTDREIPATYSEFGIMRLINRDEHDRVATKITSGQEPQDDSRHLRPMKHWSRVIHFCARWRAQDEKRSQLFALVERWNVPPKEGAPYKQKAPEFLLSMPLHMLHSYSEENE